MPKVVVQFSGGKDSQACLIWAVKEFGANKVTALFCDTKWEHDATYAHVQEVVSSLGVELVTLVSSKYPGGMVELAKKKKRFPSTKARFCTEELKVIPVIDWILEQRDHLLIIQGIRSDESAARSKMEKECRFFKYYLQPYRYDKNGRAKYHTYRKKEVLAWIKEYDDSILRPVISWTAEQVISYILENGQKPNPLYYQGAGRVGCYPCVMARHSEIRELAKDSEYLERLNAAEVEVGSAFFSPGYIPDRFCSMKDANGKKYPALQDVVKYVQRNDLPSLFEDDEPRRCMSIYNICEH
jgi:3'-phosphoadenosine 5'-phosphosulfate sulfotransferase (PAPS reductase)/FAD synthetase